MATENKKEPKETVVGEVVTKAKLAKIFGKSPRLIGFWEDDGMPSIRIGSGRGGNRINTADAIAWFVNREIQKRVAGESGPVSIDVERLRLVSEQADEKSIKNSTDRGELIAAEFVSEFAMTTVANLTGALSGLAGRMANEVARESDPAKCRELLKREINRARIQFADSFEQLSQSFDDRADALVDNQSATG